MRLFFALPLPESVRTALAALRTDLGKVRWVPADQLHLTLRFLGELDEPTATNLIEVVEAQRAARPWPVQTVSIKGVGIFGPLRRPRVLWAAVDPPTGARRIADELEHAVREAGLPPEERPFAAHVTLARFRSRVNTDALEAFLKRSSDFATASFEVEEVVLYRSTLSSSGAAHEPLHRFALAR
jgi:2'-5' RNA ligase